MYFEEYLKMAMDKGICKLEVYPVIDENGKTAFSIGIDPYCHDVSKFGLEKEAIVEKDNIRLYDHIKG